MQMPKMVTVIGGSGFVGRQVVQDLAEAGARVRVACRDPEAALSLKPMGDVGQVTPVQANIRDEASIRAAVQGADAVVNRAAPAHRWPLGLARTYVGSLLRYDLDSRAAEAIGAVRIHQHAGTLEIGIAMQPRRENKMPLQNSISITKFLQKGGHRYAR